MYFTSLYHPFTRYCRFDLYLHSAYPTVATQAGLALSEMVETYTYPPEAVLSTKLINDARWLLAGIVASTIVYTSNICLATICFRTLLRGNSEANSMKRLCILCVYIVDMMALATASVKRSNSAFMESYRVLISSTPNNVRGDTYERVSYIVFETDGIQLYDFVMSPSMPITIWCSDGILVRAYTRYKRLICTDECYQIWRCMMLYQAISQPKKKMLHVALILLALFSLGVL